MPGEREKKTDYGTKSTNSKRRILQLTGSLGNRIGLLCKIFVRHCHRSFSSYSVQIVSSRSSSRELMTTLLMIKNRIKVVFFLYQKQFCLYYIIISIYSWNCILLNSLKNLINIYLVLIFYTYFLNQIYIKMGSNPSIHQITQEDESPTTSKSPSKKRNSSKPIKNGNFQPKSA